MSDVTTVLFLGKNFRVKSHDDATWILSSAFVVFTMQSGKNIILKFSFLKQSTFGYRYYSQSLGFQYVKMSHHCICVTTFT